MFKAPHPVDGRHFTSDDSAPGLPVTHSRPSFKLGKDALDFLALQEDVKGNLRVVLRQLRRVTSTIEDFLEHDPYTLLAEVGNETDDEISEDEVHDGWYPRVPESKFKLKYVEALERYVLSCLTGISL